MAATPRALALGKPPAPQRAATVIEVLRPGVGALPARSRGKDGAQPVAERLADLLEVLVSEDSAPVIELNFRKALEALAPASEATVVAWVEHLEGLGPCPATPIAPDRVEPQKVHFRPSGQTIASSIDRQRASSANSITISLTVRIPCNSSGNIGYPPALSHLEE